MAKHFERGTVFGNSNACRRLPICTRLAGSLNLPAGVVTLFSPQTDNPVIIRTRESLGPVCKPVRAAKSPGHQHPACPGRIPPFSIPPVYSPIRCSGQTLFNARRLENLAAIPVPLHNHNVQNCLRIWPFRRLVSPRSDLPIGIRFVIHIAHPLANDICGAASQSSAPR